MTTQQMETRLTQIEQAISDLQYARDIAKSNKYGNRVDELNKSIELKIAQHDEIINKLYFNS